MRTGLSKMLLLTLTALTAVGAVVASIAASVAWPVAAVVAFASFAAATGGAATKATWARAATYAAYVVSAAAIAVGFAFDGPVWALPVVAAAGLGWFVLRTAGKYLDPADALPVAVLTRLEQHLQFAGDSVAGLHVAVRPDGAAFLVGYGGNIDPLVEDAKAVARFRTSADTGVEILSRQGLGSVTPLLVVDGTKVRARFGAVEVASLDAVGSVVERADAPAFEEIVAAAEAAGVRLNRATARQVRSGRGQPAQSGPGKKTKVVHNGRVTRRAD